MKGREVRLQGIQTRPKVNIVTVEQLAKVVKKEGGECEATFVSFWDMQRLGIGHLVTNLFKHS